jgi:hypothetical protein
VKAYEPIAGQSFGGATASDGYHRDPNGERPVEETSWLPISLRGARHR